MNALLAAWLFGSTAVFAGVMEEEGAPGMGQPRILLSGNALDFGKVAQLQEKTETISFLNDGDADLRILDIQTDCSCTPLFVKRKVCKPGEEGEIAITFSADLEPGLKKGHFIIHTNDPEQPAVKITTQGTVEPEYEFEPHVLNFGTYRSGDREKSLYLTAAPAAAEGLFLKSARCEGGFLSVECESSLYEEGRPVRIKVTLGKEAPPGRFKTQLILETDHPRIPLWKIPVIGVVRGDIRVFPTVVTFGTVEHGDTSTRTIVVIHEDESAGPPGILQVTSPLGCLKTRIQPGDRNNECKVVLSLSPDAPCGRIDAKITIKTGSALRDEHVVRVFGIVNKK